MENKTNGINKTEFLDFVLKVEEQGLVIDRDLTGQAISLKFGIPLMSSKLLIDSYLRGELKC